jgi:SpoVK/Ycf46/Vps4 family AAA+-type ATPase
MKRREVKLPTRLYHRPILPEAVENQVLDAVQSFVHRGTWKQWGLDKLREQGVAVLLHGPPGVGKTMTAYYISKRLHLGIREVSIADYGSQQPGQLARNIRQIFNGELIASQQEHRQPPVIFLDECDHMLVARNKLGHDLMWMLEPITALYTSMSMYPGLMILSTNMLPMLDEALERRLIASIRFLRPDQPTRLKLWKEKWPDKFPCQPTAEQLEQLSKYDFSGAEIENVLLLWAGQCLRQEIQPEVTNLIAMLGFHYEHHLETLAA